LVRYFVWIFLVHETMNPPPWLIFERGAELSVRTMNVFVESCLLKDKKRGATGVLSVAMARHFFASKSNATKSNYGFKVASGRSSWLPRGIPMILWQNVFSARSMDEGKKQGNSGVPKAIEPSPANLFGADSSGFCSTTNACGRASYSDVRQQECEFRIPRVAW